MRDTSDSIIEESAHYFCDHKKHQWSEALPYIRKHIEWRKEHFKSKYDRKLERCICYSDNGEFQCTAFLAKVAEIADDLDVKIEWNFTCAGHSKGKHDAEGHVIKTEIRSAKPGKMISHTR